MDQIECPKCHHKFELTESLAGPLVAAARLEAIADADRRVAEARKSIEADAVKKATAAATAEMSEQRRLATEAKEAAAQAQVRLTANEVKLAEAQQAQAAAVKERRELEDARRELNLEIERRVADGAAMVRASAVRQAEESLNSKIQEKELTIAGMAAAIEDLKRKAAQGSTQTQGEAQELALESALRERFPTDSIEPVGKGVQGGDCVQVVPDSGKILWESKKTKSWSDGWLAKLRDDGRAAGADLLVIVTTALPKGQVAEFDLVEGVWVCLPRHAVALAAALRQSLMEAAAARAANEGLETKAGLVYTYLTGPRFKSRVSAIVEAFTTMREDLDSERRAIQKAWSKREAQIDRVLSGTVGMYGDLQAIAGRSLAEIEGLDVTAIAAPK